MNEILKIARSLEGEVAAFLREIIAIPSMSSEEGAVIERIREEMARVGFEETRVDGLGNLLGRIGSGPRVLVIDSHCDTVDVGNPDLWTIDPFQGDMRDGVIYGRGACDLKGGLASSIYAGKILRQAGVPADVN
ncbi:MAG: M20/M25/M40 family metallo-hydrolase, partial [Calditrichaeota bacterium]|nr:M20/M25/M40 family metallo-hydrolase [Calditrichota bacterium]